MMNQTFRRLVLTICLSILLPACAEPGPSEMIPTSTPGMEERSPSETPSTSPSNSAPNQVSATPENTLMAISPANIWELAKSQTLQEPGAQVFAWTAGNQTLAVGLDQEIALFTTSHQEPIAVLSANHPEMLTASLERVRLAWAGDHQTIHIWDGKPSGEAANLPVQAGEITSLALSSSGSLLASATFDNSLTLWDPSTGQALHTWPLPSFLSNLSFSPDESRLAGVDPRNFSAHIFDLHSFEEVQTLSWTEHASPVLYSAHFSPDWKYLAWVARGTVQLMNVSSGVMSLALQHEDAVTDLAWSPDGSLIAVLTAATVEENFVPVIVLWQTTLDDPIRIIPLNNPGSQIGFSPSGKELAVLESQGSIVLWSVSD